MKIALIVAMDKEFAQLRSLLENEKAETHRNITFVTGTIGTHQLVLLQCGIGKVNSTIGAVEMINRYAPQLVVSTGVANESVGGGGRHAICLSRLVLWHGSGLRTTAWIASSL